MSIDVLLSAAQVRLTTLPAHASLVQAAGFLRPGTDMLVVCDSTGGLLGVITKSDVVAQISGCQGASCMMSAASVMKRDVVLCRSGESLSDVWTRMKERGLKNLPLVDDDLRPVGIVTAKDLLQELLNESADEESLMRDYVMGFGYR